MAVTTAAVVGAAAAAGGVAMSARAASEQRRAAAQAAEAAQNSGVNVADVSRQAEEQALRNIIRSREIEDQYSPGNRQFREGSLAALLQNMNNDGGSDEARRFIDRASTGSSYAGPVSGQPLQAQEANSALLQDAVARARQELALGHELPQDVRNLIARQAAATSGRVSGGLGLGRDIGLRDLGLTSLDVAQRRLTNAGTLGQAELGANQFNASQRFNTDAANLNARQFDASQRQQASQFDTGNNLNIAQMLTAMRDGDFSRYFSAAQLGQQIAPPVVGLDPSAIANLAVGNSNLQANAAQQAAGLRGAAASGMGQLGGSLTGLGLAGLNMMAQRQQQPQPAMRNYTTTFTGSGGAPAGTSIFSTPLYPRG